MKLKRVLGASLLAVTLVMSGCGGGGGSSSVGGGGTVFTNGEIVTASGTVLASDVHGKAFATTIGHAYSVELIPTGTGNPDLIVSDNVPPASDGDWGTVIGSSSNAGGDVDVVSFIAASAMTAYGSAYTPDSSADYSLTIYNNQLTVDGPVRSRKTQNSSVYFGFEAVAGQAYRVTVTPSTGDPILSLYADSNTSSLISTSNNADNKPENIYFIAAQTQSYYFIVSNNDTSVELDFTTEVKSITPDTDLQVSINGAFYLGGNLTVDYTVSNIGLVDSTLVNVDFWLNADVAPVPGVTAADAQVAIGSIAPGSSTSGTLVINAGALTAGTLWAYVDPENILAELDESNNISSGYPWLQPSSYDFEDGQMPAWFVASGNAGWQIESAVPLSGAYSMRAALITHNQSACIAFLAYSSTITFDWKVSSEVNWDFLRFYIDNVQQTAISGVTSASGVTYSSSVAVHEYKWCYTKDASVSSNFDTGWVDNILLD